MPAENQCPKCGAVLPADAPKGLCPRCLMAAALGKTVEAAGQPTIRIEPIAEEEPSQRIDRYKILQKLGEGGCGVVYMAEQTEPVRRRVALKVIKLGMDTRQVIARFEAERQALALMDHPNIAKVLDAGATETGRPYFVMELVKGIRITDYCDQNYLSTQERLGLFTQVCQAIQHAHQKGIIHRDIKPSNILVTLHDGVPVPKVIDFGIAKATEQPLTEKTVFTAFGQFMGTPAYMSPEQAELSGLDIDTRSDIYALGVLLYELLTGRTPFDAKELLQAGLDEMRRRIREEEPMRPSTRLSTMVDADLTVVAQQRQSEPAKLTRFIRGDLDWIVMKCLEKDRNRRYETANGLATDLRRHLNNEPVTACPPSSLYRFQKLVRRNKFAFAAVSAVTAALLIGLGIAAWQFFEKSKAYNRAVAAEKQARTEASKSRQVAQFLTDMLKGVGPSVALGRDTKMLREILDKTAERIGKDLTNQPAVEAELRNTVGRVYEALGEYEKAEAMCSRALEMRRKLFGNEHPDVARSLDSLGEVLLSRGKLGEAEALAREVLAMRKRLLGDEHPDVARSLHNVAVMLQRGGGKLPEAEIMFREVLTMQKKLLGDEHQNVAATLRNLAVVLKDQGKLVEAEARLREGLAMRKKLLGDEHPEVAQSLGTIAEVLFEQGKLADAEGMYRETLRMRRKLLGDEHPDVARSFGYLVNFLRRQRKYLEIEQAYDQILTPAFTSKPQSTVLLRGRADFFARGGRWKDAAADMIKVIEFGSSNYMDYHSLAPLLVASGDLENYRRHCRERIARFGETQVAHIAEQTAKDCLILPSSGVDFLVVSNLAERAVMLGTTNLNLRWFQLAKSMAEYRQGHFASAADWARKSTENPVLPDNANHFVEASMLLAMAEYKLNQLEEARAAFTKGIEIADTKLPKLESGDIGAGWQDWIITHTLMDEAKALIEANSKANKGSKTPDHPSVSETIAPKGNAAQTNSTPQ